MGGGVLPVSVHNGEPVFLFSREAVARGYRDSGKWSDFGGSKEGSETQRDTAVREAAEEARNRKLRLDNLEETCKAIKLRRSIKEDFDQQVEAAQKRATCEDSTWDEDPVIRTHQKPHHVRHHKTDKSDGTRQGYRGSGQHAGSQEDGET